MQAVMPVQTRWTRLLFSTRVNGLFLVTRRSLLHRGYGYESAIESLRRREGWAAAGVHPALPAPPERLGRPRPPLSEAPSTVPAPPSTRRDTKTRRPGGAPGNGAESVLTHPRTARDLPAETARWSTITQIYEGTNQIQRMVMARQLLKR